MPDVKTIPEMSIQELEELIAMVPRVIQGLPEPLKKVGRDFLLAHVDRAREELMRRDNP